jgi:hypothetical protein
LRRPSTAAAAAPNRIIIGGAGTGVPLLEPCQPLEPEVLDDDELLDDVLLELEVEVEVLLVMLPEVDVLVDTLPEVEELVEVDTLPELDVLE